MIKRLFICCLITFIAMPIFAQGPIEDNMSRTGSRVRILIAPDAGIIQSNDKKLIDYTSFYINNIRKILSAKITCARIFTYEDINAVVRFDRERVLLGGFSGDNQVSNLENILASTSCDYRINVAVNECANGYCLKSNTLSTVKGKTITENNSNENISEDNLLDEMDKYANRLADELLARQICIYTGIITITETMSLDENQPFQNNECNEKGYTRNMDGTTTWEIEKGSRFTASGNMKKNVIDKSVSWDYGTCVQCSQMDGDGKTVIGILTDPNNTTKYDLKVTETTQIEGLKKIYSNAAAICMIDFDTVAGTFTVKILANSNVGTVIRDRKYKCETTCPRPCDVQVDEPVTNKIQEHLDDTFGPFKGRPTDKTLSDSKTDTYNQKTDRGSEGGSVKIQVNFSRQ